MAEADGIHYSCDGRVARIVLARPEAANAFDIAMAEAFATAASAAGQAVKNGARVVVLTAEGRIFSVGGDLSTFAGADNPVEPVRRVAGGIHAALAALAEVPVPVVGAVGGTAAGGGVGIALAPDIVLASESAKFVAAYTAAGLTPDCGTSWQLARAGSAVSMDLLLTNRPLGAAEAQRLGLVSRVVPAEALEKETEELVGQLSAGSRSAAVATKVLLRAPRRDFAAHLEAEADGITRAVAGPDGREGIRAFLEKRTPLFG
ncbi:enoyl-CoA hydratase-related protein [Streptomyces sp. NPDC094034]|uniref:enoyl-CoA hydratase/isomerase family protein n=1 Tax=Streptomyces sp. NPDC094034 TaxID=3155309 RepID=UPI00332CD63D